MIPDCASCCYAREHGAGYVECLAAPRVYRNPQTTLYVREDSTCTFRPIVWRPIVVKEVAA